MSLERGESDVLDLRSVRCASNGRLSERRCGVDSRCGDGVESQRARAAKGHASLYQFREVTVPPAVALKMAKVDLRGVDGVDGVDVGKHAKQDNETTLVLPRRSLVPWCGLGLLALTAVLFLVWRLLPKDALPQQPVAATQSDASAHAQPARSAISPPETSAAPVPSTASSAVAAEPTQDAPASTLPAAAPRASVLPAPAFKNKANTRRPSAAPRPARPAIKRTSVDPQQPAESAPSNTRDFVIPDVEF